MPATKAAVTARSPRTTGEALVLFGNQIDNLTGSINDLKAVIKERWEADALEDKSRDARIEDLERWQARVVGGLIILALIAGALTTYILAFLHH